MLAQPLTMVLPAALQGKREQGEGKREERRELQSYSLSCWISNVSRKRELILQVVDQISTARLQEALRTSHLSRLGRVRLRRNGSWHHSWLQAKESLGRILPFKSYCCHCSSPPQTAGNLID